jgi:hypothetical protein
MTTGPPNRAAAFALSAANSHCGVPPTVITECHQSPFRAQLPVIPRAAPRHPECCPPSFGAQVLVIPSAAPCHSERSPPSFRAQRGIYPRRPNQLAFARGFPSSPQRGDAIRAPSASAGFPVFAATRRQSIAQRRKPWVDDRRWFISTPRRGARPEPRPSGSGPLPPTRERSVRPEPALSVAEGCRTSRSA